MAHRRRQPRMPQGAGAHGATPRWGLQGWPLCSRRPGGSTARAPGSPLPSLRSGCEQQTCRTPGTAGGSPPPRCCLAGQQGAPRGARGLADSRLLPGVPGSAGRPQHGAEEPVTAAWLCRGFLPGRSGSAWGQQQPGRQEEEHAPCSGSPALRCLLLCSAGKASWCALFQHRKGW